MHIKYNYFNKINLSDSRKDFLSDIVRLFSDKKESDIEWDKEQNYILDFFKTYPSKFHEEIFFEIVNTYLNNMSQRDNNPTFEKTNNFFLNFTNLKIFSSFKSKINQNIDFNNVISLIKRSLLIENTYIARQYCDEFLSHDNKKIHFFNNLIPSFTENRNKGILYFLMDNFYGLEKTESLDLILKYNNIDDDYLSKITHITGKFNKDNVFSLLKAIHIADDNSNTNRNLSLGRKKDILEKFYKNDDFTPTVHHFYFSNITNGQFDISQLIKSKSEFLNSINNEEYLKSWISHSPYAFAKEALPFIVKNNLVPTLTIEKCFIDILNNTKDTKHKIIFDNSFYSYIDLMANINSSSWNDPQWQKVLINLYQNQESEAFGNHILLTHLEKIQFDLPINVKIEQKTYHSLHDFLKEKENLPYLFHLFSKETNSQKKENLFSSIEKLHPNISRHIIYDEKLFKKQSFLTDFYSYSLKQFSTNEEFFNYWFIQDRTNYKEHPFEIILKDSFLKFIQQNKTELYFNVKDDNPFFNFFENRGNTKLKYNDIELFTSINSLFSNKLMNLEKNGITLFQHCKNLNIINDNNLNYLKESSITKKSFLNINLNFFNNKKVLQLQLTKNGTQLITDPNSVVEVSHNSEENKPKDYNSFSSNNFDELMYQSKQDVINLNKTLEKFNDRNLNIEIKIRADNLLFNNITFLESIKINSDLIKFEDTFFLKNNLGKYLIQCIEVYGKSICRYEALLEPDNKKLFSKQSEEDLEKYKEKIDNEALKQLSLLEKELELVKEHIINQFSHDVLKEMTINTSILRSKIEHSSNVPQIDNLIDIRKNKM